MLKDVEKTVNDITAYILDFFEKNGKNCSAVLGISGGKDSCVTAALLARALGKDRVVGVMMPDGVQSDIADSKAVVDFLGIRNFTVNIGETLQYPVPTGISTLNGEHVTQSTEVYNLAGQHVKQPTQKGVYIYKGRKKVIK